MASAASGDVLDEKNDHLCLAGNSAVQKMLQKEGEGNERASDRHGSRWEQWGQMTRTLIRPSQPTRDAQILIHDTHVSPCLQCVVMMMLSSTAAAAVTALAFCSRCPCCRPFVTAVPRHCDSSTLCRCIPAPLARAPRLPRSSAPAGQNSPLPETVVFSDFVIKINRKEKEQTRVILLTNKAVYNLLPSAYGKCKRRISLESIASVTASSISDEFVLHVPEEYDYRFKSAKKDRVCELIVRLFKKLWEKEEKAAQLAAGPQGKIKKKRIHLAYVNEQDLKEHALTKQMARLQTREDILRRKQIAQSAPADDSDQEDQNKAKAASAAVAASSSSSGANGGDDMENLLEGTEKVKLEDFELLKVLGRGSFVSFTHTARVHGACTRTDPAGCEMTRRSCARVWLAACGRLDSAVSSRLTSTHLSLCTGCNDISTALLLHRTSVCRAK